MQMLQMTVFIPRKGSNIIKKAEALNLSEK